MSMALSVRAREVAPFLAMEVMERGMAMAREGSPVIQLGVGEPDFDAPPEAIAAATQSLACGETHYTDSRGLRELREAIAADCLRRRGVRVDPDQVLVTNGTSPAILLTLSVLVNPGDEVIMATPHYPCYPNMVAVCGGRSVLVPTRPEDGFLLDVDRVRAAITKRTKAILVASPANPTGTVQPREVVEALAALGVPLLSDEIYDGLVFEGSEVTSPLGMLDDCFVLDGFSKRYAMTGFRLGYVIAPKSAMRALQSLQQNLFISVAHFVQRAGVAALEHGQPHVDHMREVYDQRRRRLVEGVRALGFGVPRAPTGAFYVLADARHLGAGRRPDPSTDSASLSLAFDLLDRAHVALGPGRDFGEAAEGFLRFSYATSLDAIDEALGRLERALA